MAVATTGAVPARHAAGIVRCPRGIGWTLLALALAIDAHAGPRCDVATPPGVAVEVALPAHHRAELRRAADPAEVETGCVMTVRDATGAVAWTTEGFGVQVHDWTGQDIDGDGAADAVLGVDTGGGNRCCWSFVVLRLQPSVGVAAGLAFVPAFARDGAGRAVVVEIVPFYGLGPDMASSPVMLRVHAFRDGRLQEVTREHCDRILADRTSSPGTRVAPGTLAAVASLDEEWARATPARREASRRATIITHDIEDTRAAVTSLALQHLVCGRSADAAQLVADTWPPAAAAARRQALDQAVAPYRAIP